MKTDILAKKLKKVPKTPGVYIFKDSKGKPIYIGKALNLKNRLGHYPKTADQRIRKMIEIAKSLKFTLTLILESQLIKRFQPQFNVVMRDDKQYFYVEITNSTSSGQAEKFPKIFLTHQPVKHSLNKPSGRYIGPFTDGSVLRSTLRFLRQIFPYCTCKQQHNNFCLNYHIEKCPGYCCLKNPATEQIESIHKNYRKNIKAIKEILSGKKESLIKKLEREMDTLAKQGELEKAIVMRNKISVLKRVFQNAMAFGNSKFKTEKTSKSVIKNLQKILNLRTPPNRIEGYDVSNIQGAHATGSMVLFENGIAKKSQYRKFKIRNGEIPNDTSMLQEILERRFRHPEWPYPDLILVDGGKGQLNTAKSVSPKNQNIIALTKNEKHVGHKIITKNGKEIFLSKLPTEIKNLILAIDSEAHRFAVSYYRKLHRKLLK